MAKREITMIPATIPKFTSKNAKPGQKRRVAAYARVSTDMEEQLTSYEAQMDYYTKYIMARSDWEFAGLYSDEGISGTSTKYRTGFNQMIEDALDGKIDLIVTKSISRFARNTVDSLVTIRKLKERGVECFFEKENIYTFDSKGELLITIMSSIAQEESRSISENVTWGQRKRFADGKVSMPYKHFLGYCKGPDGQPQVVEKEAAVVRSIYLMFLEGYAPTYIATVLTDKGIPTPTGKTRWSCSSVESILTNEKYKGDALLQKKFTVDFLTKKQKVNEGEIPQYYVTDSHEGIVSPEIFELAQYEYQHRREKGGYRSHSASPFSGHIVCGECGAYYGHKVWHSNDKYRRLVWYCNKRYGRGAGDGLRCKTPHLTDDEVKTVFVGAMNATLSNKRAILDSCRTAIDFLIDTSRLESELQTLEAERDVTTELLRKCIDENAHAEISQEDYETKYALTTLADRRGKRVSIHLFGQELQPETYAICKADLLLKGDGDQAEHIAYGSTLSVDGNPTRQFDFMLSNPPYGKSWKVDAEKMGGKKDILDSRFNAYLDSGEQLVMIPRTSDGQLLFLLNNVAKMKRDTTLGSRIAEVHNGSSLFTGDAGSGESNARRYLIENDLVEAIIAVPDSMFYNTPIGTYIWVLSNKKEDRRKGKIQLIDATLMKSPLRKNMGKKNCEFTPEIRHEIIRIFTEMEQSEVSRIFDNSEFGYWAITVERPLRLRVDLTKHVPASVLKDSDRALYDTAIAALPKSTPTDDWNAFAKAMKLKAALLKKVRPFITEKDPTAQPIEGEADVDLRDTEIIPFTYEGGIAAFMENEVQPYAADTYVDEKQTKIGYEISFTKYFYKPVELRGMTDILADLKALEADTDGMMAEIVGGLEE